MRKPKVKPDTSLKDFVDALDEIQRTKGIDKEELITTVEASLLSAYKKDYKASTNVKVNIDRNSGVLSVSCIKEVVSEVENAAEQISVVDAKEINPICAVGDMIEIAIDPKGFGRTVAQNAKQLILQRIKEAERNMIFNDFSMKKGELLSGSIHRIDRNNVYIDLGKCDGVMNKSDQVAREDYIIGTRVKVYISDVVKTNKGPLVIASRSNPGLITRLFEFEIPEIYDGIVKIKSIAREAGSRTKISVCTNDAEIDPIGSCVGHKGVRIQNIINELNGERIDIVMHSNDPCENIKNALHPAEALYVEYDDELKHALIVVSDENLTVAIGRDGQNARLAAKLCGCKIDIKSETQYAALREELGLADGEDGIISKLVENAKPKEDDNDIVLDINEEAVSTDEPISDGEEVAVDTAINEDSPLTIE